MVLPNETLTKREREVLHWVHQGLKNRDIGEKLGTSEVTIKNYVKNVFDKIGVSSRLEAAMWVEHRRADLVEGELFNDEI